MLWMFGESGRPEGAEQNSPGQSAAASAASAALGYGSKYKTKALKGRYKLVSSFAPSGLAYCGNLFPRAALVANATRSALGFSVWPLRGEVEQNARLQNSRFGLVW